MPDEKKKLKKEAESLLRQVVRMQVFEEEDRPVIQELCRKEKNAEEKGIPMTKALVLVQGVRALQGDRNAVEFLKRLAEEPEVRGEEEQVTVQVKMTD